MSPLCWICVSTRVTSTRTTKRHLSAKPVLVSVILRGANVGETSERRCWAHVGFPERFAAVLNGTELCHQWYHDILCALFKYSFSRSRARCFVVFCIQFSCNFNFVCYSCMSQARCCVLFLQFSSKELYVVHVCLKQGAVCCSCSSPARNCMLFMYVSSKGTRYCSCSSQAKVLCGLFVVLKQNIMCCSCNSQAKVLCVLFVSSQAK